MAANSGNEESSQGQTSKFLKIAAELRNKIYEMALVDDDEDPSLDTTTITIRIGLKVHPLLQTSRQIRSEAASIWLKSNHWQIVIYDCNAEYLRKWVDVVKGLIPDQEGSLSAANPHVRLAGQTCWNGCLLQWCRWIHEGKMKPLEADEDDEHPVAQAHKIAVEYRAKPWVECDKALLPLKKKALENETLEEVFRGLWGYGRFRDRIVWT